MLEPRPTYHSLLERQRAFFRRAHNPEGWDNAKSCQFPGCEKLPTYGEIWRKPTRCGAHNPEKLPDVINKRCEFPGCDKRPVFGPEWKNPRVCRKHNSEKWDDVANQRCEFPRCKKQPYFGEELGVPRVCGDHNPENWGDVKNRRCQAEGCKRQPVYGDEWGRPTVCSDHNAAGWPNVTSKRCQAEGCNKFPSYGPEWGRPLVCQDHNPEKWDNVVSKPCQFAGCKRISIYGNDWGKPLFCSDHNPEKLENVVSKRCKQEGCTTFFSSSRYRGYCVYCFLHLFPDEPVAYNYKVKEKHVTDFIERVFADHPTVSPVFDKKIYGGCSLRRPDIFFDCLTHVVVGEVDENGHNTEGYCSCENRRLMLLFTDCGDRPIVFVRINPDGYTDAHDTTHPSCFKYHETSGVPMVRDESVWSDRLAVFHDRLRHHIATIPERELTVEHLYYDGFHSD